MMDDHTFNGNSDMGMGSIIPPNFEEILKREGPIVKAVLLKWDGKAVEIDYNSTPKLMHAYSLLDGQPSIVGQYHSLNVIVARGRVNNENIGINTNKLRWPFDESKIRGNLLLYRVDDNGNNTDFTLDEYNDFLSKKWQDGKLKAEWERDCQENPSLKEKIDFKSLFTDAFSNAMATQTIDEGDEDNDGDDNEEEILFCENGENSDDMMTMEQVSDIIRGKMRQQYISKNGIAPSEEELDQLTEAAMNELLEWNKQFEDEEPPNDDGNDDEEDDDDDQEEEDNDANNGDEMEIKQQVCVVARLLFFIVFFFLFVVLNPNPFIFNVFYLFIYYYCFIVLY